jgi:hypothetical protein
MGTVKNCKVFYSWQSDLPNSTNRSFIQDALERAAKVIREDDSVKIEPVVDRDTAGVPGSPDIATTIFAKIDESEVFACDVSIINDNKNARPSPNPNVLIELGYALKALKSDRILMVMNTAFGEPKLLPFDLSKKRVITYRLPKEHNEKVSIRRELAQNLENALRTIIDHMDEILVSGELSGNKHKLKAECEAVLVNGDMNVWKKLVDQLWHEIPERMLKWKPQAETAWQKGSSERKKARFEAVEICLPSFIPIFVAVESGEKDFWKEAVGPLRQLALLSESMGGGLTNVIDIGYHMLYIAGSLGMAIAARTKQLDFVNSWMRLPMPATKHWDAGEKTWAQIYYAHRLWGKYLPGAPEPFKDLWQVCQSDYLSSFFTDKKLLEKHLFLGNLLQSLFEMGRCVEDSECLKYLEDAKKRFKIDLDVWPVWVLMKTDEFRSGTWELFGSSKGVLDFVFSGGLSLEKLWGCWKKWKEVCVKPMEQAALKGRGPILEAEWLMLPGEPAG